MCDIMEVGIPDFRVYGKQGGRMFLETPQVGVLMRPSFLSKGLKFPKKLDLQRTPLAQLKKCCHVDNHVIFSFMLKIMMFTL